MLDRLTNTLNFQSQALVLRSERQRLIASNIANADTPGYLARDVDFAKELRSATDGQAGNRPATMVTTSPLHIGGSAGGREQSTLMFAVASQNNLDGNSVDMDRERATFADNAVKYEASLRFLNSNVRTMLDAIKGGGA
ncbi:MAG: flagellar basal body rod protein FlgB [Pseudomonadota bacterium]|jgi:flagellar basal-body rod protein FlgB